MSVELLVVVVGMSGFFAGRLFQWVRDARSAMSFGRFAGRRQG